MHHPNLLLLEGNLHWNSKAISNTSWEHSGAFPWPRRVHALAPGQSSLCALGSAPANGCILVPPPSAGWHASQPSHA